MPQAFRLEPSTLAFFEPNYTTVSMIYAVIDKLFPLDFIIDIMPPFATVFYNTTKEVHINIFRVIFAFNARIVNHVVTSFLIFYPHIPREVPAHVCWLLIAKEPVLHMVSDSFLLTKANSFALLLQSGRICHCLQHDVKGTVRVPWCPIPAVLASEHLRAAQLVMYGAT